MCQLKFMSKFVSFFFASFCMRQIQECSGEIDSLCQVDKLSWKTFVVLMKCEPNESFDWQKSFKNFKKSLQGSLWQMSENLFSKRLTKSGDMPTDGDKSSMFHEDFLCLFFIWKVIFIPPNPFKHRHFVSFNGK